ncbi:hypothetical protein LJB96_01220 [Methanobrevibacter sp. OttesenSCG-928-K11]|nr:hypothetical protein [Methanobrevibacter sp. OttesenSCG-928-K11]MDL2270426.1 hypothetical protein [Methanobrevibacter sp. OttesenSCG-928-I08]
MDHFFSIILNEIIITPLEKLFEKLNPTYSIRLSFEGKIIQFLFLCSGIFVGCYFAGYFINNMILGYIIGSIFLYPICFMFLRRKTCFNEESKVISNKRDVIIGYDPTYYWFLSLISSLSIIIFGLLWLSVFFNINNIPLISFPILGIYLFITTSLILCPDYINKFLVFDIRKQSGFYLYSIINILLYNLILVFLIALISMIF